MTYIPIQTALSTSAIKSPHSSVYINHSIVTTVDDDVKLEKTVLLCRKSALTSSSCLCKFQQTTRAKDPLYVEKTRPSLSVQEKEFVILSRAKICSSFLVKIKKEEQDVGSRYDERGH